VGGKETLETPEVSSEMGGGDQGLHKPTREVSQVDKCICSSAKSGDLEKVTEPLVAREPRCQRRGSQQGSLLPKGRQGKSELGFPKMLWLQGVAGGLEGKESLSLHP
jgi:hypothetical protein